MAALNRLSQRIKENFAETTRDLKLLSGTGAAPGSSSSTYFDVSDEKLREISTFLDSKHETEKLEGMKRIIAGISKGRDMERFFAQVVKNVVTPSVEVRKLSYIFLLRYAAANTELLLLSINTFQKDLSDPSPLIRTMSLRVLTSIRVPIIQGIVILGLRKLSTDRNPWVRKTVAMGLSKVFSQDSTALSQLIPILQTLLGSQSPLTLGATLTAFEEICPDRLDILHPFYRHICRLLMDADEWGQAVGVGVLTRYARAMLEKPEERSRPRGTKEGESEDEFEGLDEDLAMLLHYSKPLFHSRNPCVVLATARMYYALAPENHSSIGRDQLVAPLLRIASSGTAGRQEIQEVTWAVIRCLVQESPRMFDKYHTRFFVHADDTDLVKVAKIRALSHMLCEANALASIREFRHYVRYPSPAVCSEAVYGIGECVRRQPTVAATGLTMLMRLLHSDLDPLVSASVLVFKSIILSAGSTPGLPPPEQLVSRLAGALIGISNACARATVFWLVGQYAASDVKLEHGFGWEGVAPWVPDVLRTGIKEFTNEPSQAKLQILTLAAKVLVTADVTPQLIQMTQYLLALARYDADYDVRDRSRFFSGLLRGVKNSRTGTKGDASSNGDDKDAALQQTETTEDDEEEEMSGVVLRREQIRVILLGMRAPDVPNAATSDFEVGTFSSQLGRRLEGYRPLPQWTDDPTDPSLREVDRSRFEPLPTSVSSASASAPTVSSTSMPPGPRPAAHAAARAEALSVNSPFGSSPAGSVPRETKAKFKDLDAFLNSESEEEEEDEEESDDDEDDTMDRGFAISREPMPVSAAPRRDIVPEYYDTSEEDDDEEVGEEDSDDSSEEDIRAPLTGAHR